MIELYSGTPGSGKSLHAAHEMADWLRAGKNVISTCMIDTDLVFLNPFQKWYVNHFNKKPKKIKRDKRADNFYYIPIEDITPEWLYEFAAKNHSFGKERQTVVFLDECVAIFSPTVLAAQKGGLNRWNEWDTFFRKHRHIGFEVVLIPQSKKLIARKVIEYCEFEVKHYNRKNQGFIGWIFSLFCGGSLFSWSRCWRGTGEKPFEQGFYTYKPLYGLMYNSYSMFYDTLNPYKEQEKKKLLQQFVNALTERIVSLKDEKNNGVSTGFNGEYNSNCE